MPNIASMDALNFLIARKWPSPRKIGLVLLLATLVSWFNLQAATIVPTLLPSLYDHLLISLLWGVIVMLAGLLAIVTGLSLLMIVPLYAFHRVSGILQSWIRQRAVEEMLCSGLTGRAVLDALVSYATRWWLWSSVPGAIAAVLLWPELRESWLAPALLAYLALGAAGGYLYLCIVAWSSFPGGARAVMPVLVPACLLQLVPAFLVQSADFHPVSLLVGCLYVILAGRWAAIYGLENWESLSRVDLRVRRLFRGKARKKSAGRLSENPIAARETMRGLMAADFSMKLFVWGGFAWTSMLALNLGGYWLFAFFLAPVVVFNSYRGALRMSQMVVWETEGSTLETLRSTPLSSEIFLFGWIQAVVLPQWRENAALLVGSAGVLALMGQSGRILDEMVLMGVCLCFLLPIVGAYIGASIASQKKTRGHISGQLMASFAATAVLGGPQILASPKIISLPLALAGLLILSVSMCWVLDAGARKSLNRVFLPQS